MSQLFDGRHTCGSSKNTCVCLTCFILILLLSCSIVIYYILWCLLLLLVGPGIIFLLLPRIDVMSFTSIVTLKLLCKKTANLAKLFSTPQIPYPHLPRDLRMVFVFIWSAFFCLICLASLQCLFQVASTLELSTLQSEVSANNYRFWANVFPILPCVWLVVVVNLVKITDQDFPGLDCSV